MTVFMTKQPTSQRNTPPAVKSLNQDHKQALARAEALLAKLEEKSANSKEKSAKH